MTPLRRRLPAIEAAALLTVAYAATKLLGSTRLMRVIGRAAPAEPRQTTVPDLAARARRTARTVDAVAAKLPWSTACLPRALTLRAMLRRRGIRCELHLGITSTMPLAAHAWVTAGGTVVHGGPVGHVTPLATIR